MKILIADDNHFYRLALETTLREWGYDVVTVADGLEAVEHLEGPDAPPMAILDWMMPGLDGIGVCRRIRSMARPESTYIIMLTARERSHNIITALNSGADDYLTKPFDRDELQARLQVGTRIVALQTSETAVYTFARAVEAKSPYTQGHSARVTQYAMSLAEALDLPAADRQVLRKGALLHDIGKIGIPDAILEKAGPLTGAEYEIIKQHPVQGVRMIDGLQSLSNVVPLVRWHHERLDGSGYPDALRGAEIPLLVRILAVADIYDAIANDRPYRPALSCTECLDFLSDQAAQGRLDSRIVNCFCRVVKSWKAVPRTLHGVPATACSSIAVAV